MAQACAAWSLLDVTLRVICSMDAAVSCTLADCDSVRAASSALPLAIWADEEATASLEARMPCITPARLEVARPRSLTSSPSSSRASL